MAKRKEKRSLRQDPTIRELIEPNAKCVHNEVTRWSQERVAAYLEENAKECFTIKAKLVKNLSRTSYNYIDGIPCKLVATFDDGKSYIFLRRDMRNIQNRLYSFWEMKWPDDIATFTFQLAEAGFFYEGDGEAVRCFSCNGQISQWQGRASPLDEHRRLFSNCEFAKRHSQSLSQARRTINSYDEYGFDVGPDPGELSIPEHHINRSSESHNHFKSEFNRLLSYRTWSNQSFVHPSDLAASGFYCISGSSGVVECFSCGGRIADWKQGDQPHRRHRQLFPQCPFIRNEETGNINITNDEKERLLVHLSETNQTLETDHQETLPSPSPAMRTRIKSTNDYQESGNNHFYRNAKYQQYYKEDIRLKSFSGWPYYNCQRPESLAQAGFFSTQKGDETKCFYCGGGLQNWSPEHEPWREHARWFSRCDWLLSQKGSSFVKMVQRHFSATEGGEFAENASATGPGRPQKMAHHQQTESASRNRKMSDNRVRSNQSIEAELELALETDVANFMLDMGFSVATIRTTIRKRLEAGGRPFTTSEDLLLAITQEVGDENQGNATSCTSRNHDTSSNENTFTRANGPRTNEDRCYICDYKPIEIMTVPCHHAVVCEDCSAKSNTCFYCKQKIESVLFVVS